MAVTPGHEPRGWGRCYAPGLHNAGRGQEQTLPFFASAWKDESPAKQCRRAEECGHHHPKTDIVVAVVGVVVVAGGAAGVPRIVVERAAPQHTGMLRACPRKAQR